MFYEICVIIFFFLLITLVPKLIFIIRSNPKLFSNLIRYVKKMSFQDLKLVFNVIKSIVLNNFNHRLEPIHRTLSSVLHNHGHSNIGRKIKVISYKSQGKDYNFYVPMLRNGNHEEFKVEVIFDSECIRDITQESGTPYIVKGSDFGPKATSVRISNLTTNEITELSIDEEIKLVKIY